MMMSPRPTLSKALSLQACARRCYATLNELATLRGTRPANLYEPPIEKSSRYPCYPALTVRLQSYDFVPLERFQSFVHRTARDFNFTVVDSFAVAGKSTRVQTFKPQSSKVDSEVDIVLYDRWIRLADVEAVRLPLFLTLVNTHAPIGTQIGLKVFEKADEAERYIPNLELKTKQAELRALDDPLVRRFLGWE